MGRKSYSPPAQTHNKKVTRKERKKQNQELRDNLASQDADAQPAAPTVEDKEQIRKLVIYSVVGIFAVLALMYWIFMSS